MDFLDFTKPTFFDPPILAQPAKSTGSPGHPGTIPPLGSVTLKT
jgi:hypothetical protein